MGDEPHKTGPQNGHPRHMTLGLYSNNTNEGRKLSATNNNEVSIRR